MAKPAHGGCKFFRPRPQGLIDYLSGLPGMEFTELHQQIENCYDLCCMTEIQAITGDEDVFIQMMLQVWKDKGLPVGLISKEVVMAMAAKYFAGVTGGFGKDLHEVDYDTPDYYALDSMQQNVWQFAGAENYTQLRELGNALIGEDGKLRSFQDFKAAGFGINDKFARYRETEYNLAVAGGQMGGKWVDIEKNAAILPFLEFDAVMDTQTTALCAGLNGTTLPVNHPFWNTYYPPNHFGCRSTVRQKSYGPASANIPAADIPPMFQTNLGKQGLIFPPKHPFFTGLPKEVSDSVRDMVPKKPAKNG